MSLNLDRNINGRVRIVKRIFGEIAAYSGAFSLSY